MTTGAPAGSGWVVGGPDLCADLLGPLGRALDRSTRALELIPAEAEMMPKVLGECAMLVHAAAPLRRTTSRLRDAVDVLAERVAAGTRTDRTALRILVDPAHALDHAGAHVLLTAAGYPDAAFHRRVASVLDGPRAGLPQPERLPHRELEQRWLGRMLAIEEDGAEDSVLVGSALGRPLDALAATRLDAYAFTHCVMYAHDLGRRRPRLPRPVVDVVADAEAGLALAVDTGDLDLAVELLLTWPLVGAPLGPVAGSVLERVLRTEAGLGFLPGLGFEPEHDEATTVLANYHPATVMGMFAAVAVRAAIEVPVLVPARPSRLAGLVDAWPGALPPWVEEAVASTPTVGLEPLILTAALRRAVAHADVPAVRRLLTVSLELDLAHGPAVRAATGLLRRLSTLLPGVEVGTARR